MSLAASVLTSLFEEAPNLWDWGATAITLPYLIFFRPTAIAEGALYNDFYPMLAFALG